MDGPLEGEGLLPERGGAAAGGVPGFAAQTSKFACPQG
jgi:hypothetical protein